MGEQEEEGGGREGGGGGRALGIDRVQDGRNVAPTQLGRQHRGLEQLEHLWRHDPEQGAPYLLLSQEHQISYSLTHVVTYLVTFPLSYLRLLTYLRPH